MPLSAYEHLRELQLDPYIQKTIRFRISSSSSILLLLLLVFC